MLKQVFDFGIIKLSVGFLCVRFSVLIEINWCFPVLDDFLFRFSISNRSQCPRPYTTNLLLRVIINLQWRLFFVFIFSKDCYQRLLWQWRKWMRLGIWEAKSCWYESYFIPLWCWRESGWSWWWSVWHTKLWTFCLLWHSRFELFTFFGTLKTSSFLIVPTIYTICPVYSEYKLHDNFKIFMNQDLCPQCLQSERIMISVTRCVITYEKVIGWWNILHND